MDFMHGLDVLFPLAFFALCLASVVSAGVMVLFARSRGFRSRSTRWSGACACGLLLLAAVSFVLPRAFTEFTIMPAGGVSSSADGFGPSNWTAPPPPAQSLPRQPTASRSSRVPAVPLSGSSRAPLGGPPAQSGGQSAPPATLLAGGREPVNDAPFDAMFFQDYGTNPFIDTEDDALSTFAVDVDSGSYLVSRAYILEGYNPEPAGVRVEEFLNHFDYGYAVPDDGTAFVAHLEGAPSPFGTERHTLLRMGIRGRDALPASERRPVSVIFTVDVSGSMGGFNLQVAQALMREVLGALGPDDRVGVVTYGNEARTLLPPVGLDEPRLVLNAIDSLAAGGSTFAEAGIRQAFWEADREVDGERNVRIILISDGVANVGQTGSEGILRSVREYAGRRIYLNSVGIGLGNYNDVLLEQLANNGDGVYHYLNSRDEVGGFVDRRLPGLLDVIARDAKLQVEFNPEVVRSYRLMGYENRDVADEDFRNDAVDAGEIGAGHSVTALYEIKLHPGAAGPMATVRMRHEDPEDGRVEELSWEYHTDELLDSPGDASPSWRLAAAVAQLAEVAGESFWARGEPLRDLVEFSQGLPGDFPNDPDVRGFFEVVELVSAGLR